MHPNMGQVVGAMIQYNYGCPELINHALKVYAFAKAIGEKEQIPVEKQAALETAAVLHDIGIRISEEKYGSFSGKYQQIEGPSIAKELLTELGCGEVLIERVCYLIAHHHEYHNIDDVDYQILVEADFLVNIFEENNPPEMVETIRGTIFQTKAGREFLDNLFRKAPPRESLFAKDLEKIALKRAGIDIIPLLKI